MAEVEVIEVEAVAEEVEEEAPEKSGELSDVEALATKLGWNPNHEGGDREFVSAEDFILRSKEIQTTMSKQMKNLKRETEELKRGIGQVKQHNETVYKVQVKALKSRIKELEALRREAVEDNDSMAVASIDSQIKEINDIPETLPANEHVGPTNEFLEWVDENEWYNENPEMRAYADALGEKPEYRALPLKKLFAVVTRETKKMFPENFDDEPAPKPKQKVAAVEGAGSARVKSQASKSKFKYSDLSDEQKEICKFNEKHGIMTREEYISQLEEIAKNRGLA
jgi:hypothetical protein